MGWFCREPARRWGGAGLMLTTLACGGAPEAAAPPAVRAPVKAARPSSSTAPVATVPRLTPSAVASTPAPSPVPLQPEVTWTPLHEKPEGKCNRAERWRNDARDLHEQGWNLRAKQLLEHAKASCARLDVAGLQKTVRDALKTTSCQASLEAQMRAAEQAGNSKQLHRLASQWFPIATKGRQAELLFRPEGRVAGFDDAWTIIARDTRVGRKRTSLLTVVDGKDGRPRFQIAVGGSVLMADRHGDQLLAVSDTLTTWSLKTGKQTRVFSWTNEKYRMAAFVAGGQRILAVGGGSSATTGFTTVVRSFNASTGANTGSLSLRDLRSYQTAAGVIDDKHVLLVSTDKAIVVNFVTMSVVRRLLVSSTRANKPATIASFAIAEDGRIALSTHDGAVRIWGKHGTPPMTRVETGRRAGRVFFAPDPKKFFYLINWEHELLTFDIKSGIPEFSREVNRRTHVVRKNKLLSGRVPTLRTMAGKAIWGRTPTREQLGSVVISEGLGVTHETRAVKTGDSQVTLNSWYRHQHRTTVFDGYKDDLIDISPSGRRVALGPSVREVIVFDQLTASQHELPVPRGATWIDLMGFQTENRLHALHVGPLVRKVTSPKMEKWEEGQPMEQPKGRVYPALSSEGTIATETDGKLKLEPDLTVVETGAKGALFSGDGKRLFTRIDDTLVAFDLKGSKQSSQPMDCEHDLWASNHDGTVVAWACDDGVHIARVGASTTVLAKDIDTHLSELAMSPSGHLVAVRTFDNTVVFLESQRGARVATMTLNPTPYVTTSDGSAWYPSNATWRAQAACRLGHRAVPVSWCEGGLIDDTLMERLLLP